MASQRGFSINEIKVLLRNIVVVLSTESIRSNYIVYTGKVHSVATATQYNSSPTTRGLVDLYNTICDVHYTNNVCFVHITYSVIRTHGVQTHRLCRILFTQGPRKI